MATAQKVAPFDTDEQQQQQQCLEPAILLNSTKKPDYILSTGA